MSNLIRNAALSCGAGVLSILAAASPGTAAIFYDLEFFDDNGVSVGTGEFSHADEPFEGTIDLCYSGFSCDYTPLTINAEDQFFRVESFSSNVRGLDLYSSTLFWRPFDDERVASISRCTACPGGIEFTFSENAWFDGIAIAVITRIDRMTATTWTSFLDGMVIPAEAEYDLSGTWTATRRTPVPEPASALGLLALGALGVSRLKRDRG